MTGKSPYGDIPWISDSDFNKACFQLRGSIDKVLESFRCYGLEVFIPGAIIELEKLAIDFSLRCRGVDHPINIDMIRRGK